MNEPKRDKPSKAATSAKWAGLLAAVLLVGLIAGAALQYAGAWFFGRPGGAHSGAQPTASGEKVLWTCSMHPQVKLPSPGLCPICHMALEPLDQDDASDDDALGPVFTTSPQAAALMDLQTAEVRREFVAARINMVGKVDYDETRLKAITAWVPGRLDRLYVDYTGIPVKTGDHMVSLYSPQLLSTQEELLQAKRSVQNLEDSDLGIVKASTLAMLDAAREKLRLLGLTQEQVDRLEKTGAVSDHLTIYAPQSGIVIEKLAKEGMYVETGTRIYTVADLSKVWVQLDAYESDLMWLRYGQAVTFTTVTHPGETFEGTISFIDPVLNEKTRTVKLRVIADNDRGKLKPGMFVRAAVTSRIAAGGRVMDPDLVGKWISPMHPQVVKDQPGACDVCGMPLVRAESLGYVAADPANAKPPLVVPRSAVLVTGRRAVVYVEDTTAERPTYVGREIVLGPRAGEHYLVESGLAEGERVVTHGNFKIDSALQIRARPSMLSPTGTLPYYPSEAGKLDATFARTLGEFVESYLALSKSLAEDDVAAAQTAAGKLPPSLAGIDASGLSQVRGKAWSEHAGTLKTLAADVGKAEGIEPMRTQFALLSEEVLAVIETFGSPTGEPLYRVHCPMAFNDRGADWLQSNKEVLNPYFGSTMLRCGSVKATYTTAQPAASPSGAHRPKPPGGHGHEH